MIKVFLNWVQKTKPHIKSETGLLLFVPTIKLTVYLRIPCRIFINSFYILTLTLAHKSTFVKIYPIFCQRRTWLQNSSYK